MTAVRILVMVGQVLVIYCAFMTTAVGKIQTFFSFISLVVRAIAVS